MKSYYKLTEDSGILIDEYDFQVDVAYRNYDDVVYIAEVSDTYDVDKIRELAATLNTIANKLEKWIEEH